MRTNDSFTFHAPSIQLFLSYLVFSFLFFSGNETTAKDMKDSARKNIRVFLPKHRQSMTRLPTITYIYFVLPMIALEDL